MSFLDKLISNGERARDYMLERNEVQRRKAKAELTSKLWSAYYNTDDPERKKLIREKLDELKNM